MTAGCWSKSGAQFDHAMQAQPGAHASEIAQFPLEAAKHRKRHRLRRSVALLDRHFSAHFPEGAGDCAIGILRTVPGDVGDAAVNPHE